MTLILTCVIIPPLLPILSFDNYGDAKSFVDDLEEFINIDIIRPMKVSRDFTALRVRYSAL